MSEILKSPLLWHGAGKTLQLTLYSAVFALVLAFLFGLMGTSTHLWLRAIGRTYVEFFRGLPALILMFWFFYSLPLVGFRLETLFCGVLALSLNYGAYGAEVVRGSINAVPKAQYEATIALNMRPMQRMRRVLMPQAVPLMLPPFGNLLIELLKATAIVSLISISDLMFGAEKLRASTGKTVTVYLIILVVYFVIAQVLQVLVRLLERRSQRSLGRRPQRGAARSIAGTAGAQGAPGAVVAGGSGGASS
ncbi:ectoine/hydroxyectoine ABC transporter permease subunit EhuC [Actinomadura barringtoniae]|uniref:Ectoine/hydroxyectoine ABC transporter permease subunit EhuC n=1 Tax=Actinomadura barringtoniae TaxID=1427535 RepID=A0A939PBS7_9ACTN|nr:ectoine/hydroxyectoine ABC transporter permease subunit EhuC [Actinomadura barringtoniae]MBO2449690.1 ectoine/hydroxyectoine ABC transporter permease subunit EhuC [Actinomadura barringtoniae]